MSEIATYSKRFEALAQRTQDGRLSAVLDDAPDAIDAQARAARRLTGQ